MVGGPTLAQEGSERGEPGHFWRVTLGGGGATEEATRLHVAWYSAGAPSATGYSCDAT